MSTWARNIGEVRCSTVRLGALLLGVCLLACQTTAAVSQVVKKPRTYVAIKYEATVKQQYDFTCGGAALATILTYYWNRPTTEVEVLDILKSRYPGVPWKNLQEKGFSLDDLVWTANKLGYEAQAAEIPANELEKLDGPIIVHIKNKEFEHFTVMRMRREGRTYISDPVLGATSRLNDEFDREYTGAALAIWKKGAPLPKAALLAHPRPTMRPSTIVGDYLRGGRPTFAPIY